MRNIFIILSVSLFFTLGVKAQPTFGSKPGGGGSDSGKVTGKQNSVTWTPHELDSLYVPIRVKVKLQQGEDTLGIFKYPELKHIEMTGGFVKSGYLDVRDSSIEFRDTLCIKWRLVFQGPNQPWRLYAIDTCTGATGCTPYLGDVDYTWVNLCDSTRFLAIGPQVWGYWNEDTVRAGVNKAFFIKVDSIAVPLMFQINRSRGLPTNMTDTGTAPLNGWFYVGGSQQAVAGYPMALRSGRVMAVSWTARNNTASIIGGWWQTNSGQMSISSDQQIMVKWVTNPAGRDAANNKTKFSLWKSATINGSYPPLIPDVTNIGIFEIEDDYIGTTYDNTTWVVTVIVWLLCVSASP